GRGQRNPARGLAAGRGRGRRDLPGAAVAALHRQCRDDRLGRDRGLPGRPARRHGTGRAPALAAGPEGRADAGRRQAGGQGMSVAIIGAGAFGTALAVSLASKGPVTLWGRDTGWAAARENPRLPGVALPPALHVTGRLDQIAAETVLLALPAQVLGGFLAEH